MNASLIALRLAKLWVSVTHPSCWRALSLGVAPAVEHLRILRSLQSDGVIDVGANRGQFTLACRLTQPNVPILAFEPIPAEASTYRKIHGRVARIKLLECALGEREGTATLRLSQSADSSSLLPIGKLQTALFENTAEIGTLEVQVKRLDDLSAHWTGRRRQLLKLDVQGFELNVLRGSIETLKHCAYVYAECSEVALYDGQALREEVEGFLKERGFVVLSRHNEQWIGGKLIQADYLFGGPTA